MLREGDHKLDLRAALLWRCGPNGAGRTGVARRQMASHSMSDDKKSLFVHGQVKEGHTEVARQ
ncbi:hypothetical protein [Streptomyces sp. NPDC046925]|uniref:hypothetical protein n=1 Tax=Streptomyces sp. NPDC046925 TaxID=3155375 RepID=UPI0033FD863F